MAQKKRLFLIDGSALVYRSYFAFIRNPLINSKGENTSAAFGFTNAVLKLFKDHNPDYIGVVFDTAGPTFRHEQFAEYKAHRPEMPEEMRPQIPVIKEILEAMRIPVLEMPGFEADDVMGTLSQKAKSEGVETVLVTGDKDFLQLVNSEIKVLKPRVGGSDEVLYDANEVLQRYGVEPGRIVEILGLMGDAVDNVPGVPGIGEKTAIDLVREFGTIENILRNVDKVSRRNVREALRAHSEMAFQSRELVTLHTGLPVELNLEEFARSEPDRERLAKIFSSLEFRKLLEEAAPQAMAEETVYHLVDSPEAFASLLGTLRGSKAFVVDLETTSADPFRAEIVGISFAVKPAEAFYVPLGHRGGRNLDIPLAWNGLKPLLEGETPAKIGQNIKYDLNVLARAGIKLRGIRFDTMVASYLLDPSRRQNNLNLLALELLNHKMIPLESLIGKGKNQVDFSFVPVEKAEDYSCEDADFTLRLRDLFEPQLAETGLLPLFESVEMPLVQVLAAMERNGVSLDLAFFEEMSARLSRDLKRLEGEVYAEAGEIFNINSPKQLAAVLFGKLKLPSARRTKTGYSTDVDVLEKLAATHPLPRKILDYRRSSSSRRRTLMPFRRWSIPGPGGCTLPSTRPLRKPAGSPRRSRICRISRFATSCPGRSARVLSPEPGIPSFWLRITLRLSCAWSPTCPGTKSCAAPSGTR